METLLQDLRYGVRMLIKGRSFTVMMVMILALGIGATTAIFSVVNVVLLKPLPYKDADRLVMIWENNPRLQLGIDNLPASAGNFVAWRERAGSFEQVSALAPEYFNFTGAGDPERLPGARVSANLFQLMGVEPKLGGSFPPQADQPENSGVAVISHSLWRRRFDSDPGVVGRGVTLDGKVYTVLGVMPEGFQYPRASDLPPSFEPAQQTDLWIPLALTETQIKKRGDHNLAVLARLKPNVTLQQAQAEMTVTAKALEQEYPESNAFFTATVLPLREQIVGNVRPSLLVLLAAAALVLLIACSNVANLLLARATGRQKEIAIRTALGASRTRIIRQLLTESILLSLLGGLLGILLNFIGIKLLLAALPGSLLRIEGITTDAAVLGFTAALSFVTGLFFGLAPSLNVTKVDSNEFLKEGGSKGSTGGVQRNRTRSILVISEVALSLMLMIGAGLLLKSYLSLLQVNPGLNPRNILTTRIPLAETKYPEGHQKKSFFGRVIEQVKGSPGVVAVGATSHVPLSGQEASRGFTVEGKPASSPQETPLGDNRTIDAEYFRVMEIPLVKGRLFTEGDSENAPGVVIINESMARRFFPGEDPVGKRLKMGGPNSTRPWLSVVGVVGDVKHTGLKADVRPSMYVPYAQSVQSGMTLVVRTASDPTSAAGAVRSAVRSVDPDQPLTDIKSMEQYFSDSVALQRFSMLLLGVFAVVALVLAALGVYGVMSYSVSQRTREIGIRMALGAQARDVLKLVMRQGVLLAFVGIGVGLLAAFALTRVMRNLLYDVGSTDFMIFVGASLLLVAVTLVASYVPAHRAIRIEPTVALRDD